MAFCKKCGQEIPDNVAMCPHCGESQNSAPAVDDPGGFGWGLLGFCIPIVGLILYLVWKDTKPLTAKAAGKGALIAVVIGVIGYALMAILGIGAATYYSSTIAGLFLL